jgi:hypothetical protein
VIVDAILLEIAAKRNVSNEEWFWGLDTELRIDNVLGGKVALKSSNR